jgi:hypothetical protein
MSWNTPQQAKDLWADAGHLTDATLQLLLDSAHRDCFRYLDPLDGLDPLRDGADPEPPADLAASLRLAEVYQARARYQAVKSAGNNQVGQDGMTVTVFPLDWQVQQLVRPKDGRPSIA